MKKRSIKVNHQGQQAELYSAYDPAGRIVTHLRVLQQTTIDRLYHKNEITPEQYDAAQIFRRDFERCPWAPHYSRVNPNRVQVGVVDVRDDQLIADKRLRGALDSLKTEDHKTIAWYVIGATNSLRELRARLRNGGRAISPRRLKKLLLECLENLTLHYGLTG